MLGLVALKKLRNRSLVLCLSLVEFVLTVCSGCVSRNSDSTASNDVNQIGLVNWNIGNRRKLNVVVCQRQTSNVSRPPRILKMLDGPREVFRLGTSDTFLGAFSLSDSGGDLVTLWMGGSAYHIVAFSCHDGKIRTVLDGGSKILPEIIFSTSRDEQHPVILMTDGLMNSPPSAWTTQIYSWNGRVYQSRSHVPYLKRLTQL